jgi:hypothetical protein
LEKQKSNLSTGIIESCNFYSTYSRFFIDYSTSFQGNKSKILVMTLTLTTDLLRQASNGDTYSRFQVNEVQNLRMKPDAKRLSSLFPAVLTPLLICVSKSVGKNKTELRKVNKAITLFPSAFCLLPPALP